MDIEVHAIGREQQPLLVIDNFAPDAKGLIDYAMSQTNVTPASGLYPGLRAPAPEVYGLYLRQQLQPYLEKVFKLAVDGLTKAECFYSMVATPASELKLLQSIPHFDRPQPQSLAVIHYLCDEKHGGTGFYRHRSTGFEYIDAARKDVYARALEQEIATGGEPTGYINGDTTLFERIASVDARFNRAVIYPCSSLHSGNIGENYGFDLHPKTGRFTIASFLSSS